MAREVRRFLHWYIAERYNRSLHTEPEKAPCHSELSRGVEGNPETARIADRRIAAQPSLPTPAHEARAGDPGSAAEECAASLTGIQDDGVSFVSREFLMRLSQCCL